MSTKTKSAPTTSAQDVNSRQFLMLWVGMTIAKPEADYPFLPTPEDIANFERSFSAIFVPISYVETVQLAKTDDDGLPLPGLLFTVSMEDHDEFLEQIAMRNQIESMMGDNTLNGLAPYSLVAKISPELLSADTLDRYPLNDQIGAFSDEDEIGMTVLRQHVDAAPEAALAQMLFGDCFEDEDDEDDDDTEEVNND